MRLLSDFAVSVVRKLHFLFWWFCLSLGVSWRLMCGSMARSGEVGEGLQIRAWE